tara:strand:- start:1544 stop:2173 length:630 start_codon:yes stop_codon:yes gene_type:complete
MITKKTARKRLIVSGDSWTETAWEDTWPIILANKLDMECVNVAARGRGNEFIYSSVIDKLCKRKNIGLTICMWSDFDRLDFFDRTVRTYPNFRSGEFNNLYKSMRYIHAFQNHCELNKIPFLQTQGIFPTQECDKEFLKSAQFDLIDGKKFVGWPMYRELGGSTMWDKLDEVDPDWTKLRVSKKDLHPNYKGHELIAEILYDKYKEIYI